MKDTARYFKAAYITFVLILLPLPFLLLMADFFIYGFQGYGTTLSYLATIVMMISMSIVGFTVFRKSKTSEEPKAKRFFSGLGLAFLIALFIDIFVYRLIYPLINEEFRQFFALWFYHKQISDFGIGDFFLIYLNEVIMVLIVIVIGLAVFFKASTSEESKFELFLLRLGWAYLIWFLISITFLIIGLVVTVLHF